MYTNGEVNCFLRNLKFALIKQARAEIGEGIKIVDREYSLNDVVELNGEPCYLYRIQISNADSFVPKSKIQVSDSGNKDVDNIVFYLVGKLDTDFTTTEYVYMLVDKDSDNPLNRTWFSDMVVNTVEYLRDASYFSCSFKIFMNSLNTTFYKVHFEILTDKDLGYEYVDAIQGKVRNNALKVFLSEHSEYKNKYTVIVPESLL